ncbi:MAG: DNA polymerase III subunit delta [Paraglaciecola sp.]|uniref:DNA polymerase III subunit delta n=1 Tax=Pseudomonadati TaxID=3379134 RepID=UPI00273D74D2|nr:DNA polymerase III subunit delta [Paraglaciecola sp.]MDP5030280.1 DNA polymerase III subunit delta [Paraglaciecola sp.]MDP5133824.1 DNA polymerase III subunit delta [Paraglaciecola sp.]
MQVYPNRLKAALAQRLTPFYMVFGDEPQQKMETLQAIREVALRQGFDERQSLTVDSQFNWNNLVEATQTLSLFSSKQFIELELPTGKPGTEGSKILSMLATQSSDDLLVVIHGAKIGKDVQSSKWFKLLDKNGVYVPCYPLEGNSLQQWLSQQMHTEGLQASKEICQLLADYCEGNLLAAKQEVQKLALLYPAGNPSLEQVEQAVVDQSRFTVFHLIDVLLAGDAQKALKMLYRLESEGIEPTIILWALTREWQTIQALLFAQQTGQALNWNQHRIWGNRQALYLSALQRLDLAQMHALQKKLTTLDFAIKQSQILRPYVELCHLCLMFIPFNLEAFPLDYGLSD